MTKFTFEWYNITAHKLTSYQSLVYNWLIGKLANESILKDDHCHVEIVQSMSDAHSAISIRCFNVNKSLIESYLRQFPFKSDTQVIWFNGDAEDKKYAGLYVHARQLEINREQFQVINIR